MKALFRAGVGIAALVLTATSAAAWNDRGHMMVAAVAWTKLTPSSKARVMQLLKLNPYYPRWVRKVPAGVTGDRADEIVFVQAATWADAIKKSNSGYTDDGEKPSGPQSSQNIGYADTNQHRYWHYIDEPFSTDGTPLEQPVAPNAETQIATFRAALKAPDVNDDIKSYDLVWLEHLVGDVHQPLHATSRFSQTFPHGDRGGNAVMLPCPSRCDPRFQPELHAFWDDALGKSESVTAAIHAARALHPATHGEGDDANEAEWIAQSFALARSSVYVPPIGDGAGPYTLTKSYQTAARRLAMQRVEIAGERLGNLINDDLH